MSSLKYYVVHIGGEWTDRETSVEEIENVQKCLCGMRKDLCYTQIYKDDKCVAQAELVLDNLIDISYIADENLPFVLSWVKNLGVNECSLSIFFDKECTNCIRFHRDLKIK